MIDKAVVEVEISWRQCIESLIHLSRRAEPDEVCEGDAMRLESIARDIRFLLTQSTFPPAEPKRTSRDGEISEDRLDEFTKSLTELSVAAGIGLTGNIVPFVMECGPSGDYSREYTCADTGELRFE